MEQTNEIDMILFWDYLRIIILSHKEKGHYPNHMEVSWNRVPPVIIHFSGMFHEMNHPSIGNPPFLETSISSAEMVSLSVGLEKHQDFVSWTWKKSDPKRGKNEDFARKPDHLTCSDGNLTQTQ